MRVLVLVILLACGVLYGTTVRVLVLISNNRALQIAKSQVKVGQFLLQVNGFLEVRRHPSDNEGTRTRNSSRVRGSVRYDCTTVRVLVLISNNRALQIAKSQVGQFLLQVNGFLEVRRHPYEFRC